MVGFPALVDYAADECWCRTLVGLCGDLVADGKETHAIKVFFRCDSW